MAAVMVLAVATPAVATEPAELSVSVGNTSYTVTVTHNGTAVNDTEVRVDPTDPNATYVGAAGPTDDNGTVTFDLPENETEVNISTTYNGTETTTTYLLPAAGHEDEPSWDGEGPFGQWVKQLLRNLGVNTDTPLGQQLSELVVKNNPGAEHRSDKANPGGNGNGPPDHAGKPDDVGPQGDDEEGGPPDHAKNDQGDGDDEDDEEAQSDDEGNDDNNGQGKAKGKDK